MTSATHLDVQTPHSTNTTMRPENVGILAMEVYFPANYVDQADLEQAAGISAGKITKGLGQDQMCFTGDREDVNSIALTVVQNLLEKYEIDPAEIGRLEVGTESLVDKSKSTKTVLMDLFRESGNTNIEGVTNTNACYGGTAALFNSIAWIESSAWDGRYAIVVAADIAIYDKGPARPTSGCGAVAMLLGPDAPVAMESSLRSTHASNTWDFYKPDGHVEYPTVDGHYSQVCYLKALDDCYNRFCKKNDLAGAFTNGKQFDVTAMDFAVFHSPYNKLVQKGFARVLFNDFLRNPEEERYADLLKWKDAELESTYTDRELDLVSRKISSGLYSEMVEPGCRTSKSVGNCYAASVHINIACLIDAIGAALHDKRFMVFSFGSGSMASMFSFKCSKATNGSLTKRFTIERMAKTLNLKSRLENRLKRTPEDFNLYMDLRSQFHGKTNVKPRQSIDSLFPGTYYLVSIDDKYRRSYARKDESPPKITSCLPLEPLENSRSKVIVSSVSAGIPGPKKQFDEDNIDYLLEGNNCIEKVPEEVKESMLDKNIVQLKKVDGERLSVPVKSVDECIQVAAVTKPVDLASDYGISPALAGTMDPASQIAVAAGLEALKKAGLVSGKIENGSGDWKLSEEIKDSTGIIFATSFPALDSALHEASRYYNSKGSDYTFDRKFLFRLLVLANAQLAQITGARGPNTQVNAACSGTTQAIGMAKDWIQMGKCKCVVVIAGDTAANPTLFPWIGSGFRALGASTTAATVEEAALPFDKRRSGMLLGSGSIGMVLEADALSSNSKVRRAGYSAPSSKIELVDSYFSNSAYHGAALDSKHIAQEISKFLDHIEETHGISRSEFAKNGIYYSHETFTHASPTTSCAYVEVSALREVFGDELLEQLTIANSKGFTGHPMGVSFEDVIAVEGLKQGIAPPVANFKEHDEDLGVRLNLSKGGKQNFKYALRFAAGFGSQIALTLYTVE